MGHVRLGKPPATRKWREVVDLLRASEFAVADIAAAVERSADRSLSTAVQDPGFVETFWMLLRLPYAVASEDAQSELRSLGIHVPVDAGLADFTAGFDEAFERFRRRSAFGFTDFAFIARDAAISALAGAALDRGPSLWMSDARDERATIASLATTTGFGELAQSFFTNLLRGHIRYFLDRQVPRHVGVGHRMTSIADLDQLDMAVRRHCRETTIIMRAFARDWLGKHGFQLGKKITRDDAAAFAAHALTKIRQELSRRSQPAAA